MSRIGRSPIEVPANVEVDVVDRRVTVNTITPAGRQAIDEIMGVTNALRAEVLQGIDPGELQTALKVLAQIIGRIDEMR